MLWGIVTQNNVDHAELIWGRVYSRDPDIFLTQSKPQSQSEEPKEEKAIQQSSYYPMYLKMVDENTKKTPQESASVQPATKRATPKKPTTTTPVKTNKPTPPPTKKTFPADQCKEQFPKLHESSGKGKGMYEEQVAQPGSICQEEKETMISLILVRPSAAHKGDKDQERSRLVYSNIRNSIPVSDPKKAPEALADQT
ncbi:hypothetical protein Tco_0459446 [Tanacetum coccineum]